MDFFDFRADINDSGRRIDKIVKKLMPDHSLGMIYKYFRKGLVKKNKKKVNPDVRIQEGDLISIAAFLLQKKNLQSAPTLFEEPLLETSLFETNLFVNVHIRVINKPYDIPVQGGGQIACSLDKIVVKEYLNNLKEQGLSPSLSFRPGPLHRLDRKTTGVLVFSQSLAGAQWFSQSLKDHCIGKEYLAIVEGKVTGIQYWQDGILRKSQGRGGGFTQSHVSISGKNADTLACPLAWGKYKEKPITLLHLKISTGRTHQIRLHCSHHGFPLLGDTAYGGRAIKTTTTKNQQDFFLHAWKISIPENNPLDLPSKITAPISVFFKNMIETYLPETDLQEYI